MDICNSYNFIISLYPQITTLDNNNLNDRRQNIYN